MIVNLFDQNGVGQGSAIYNVPPVPDRNDFGFYLQGPGGLFFTQDARNSDGAPRILVYNGTGANAGSLWLACDTSVGPGGSFADVIVLVESTGLVTPTASTTWSRVKSLFR